MSHFWVAHHSWNTEIHICVPKSGNRYIFLTPLGFHPELIVLRFRPCLFTGLRMRGGDAWLTTFHSQWEWVALVGRGACVCWDPFLRVLGAVPEGISGGRSAVLAPTPFAHQVNMRLQQRCVVYVGGLPGHTSCVLAVSVFLPGSSLGTTGHTVRSPPFLGVSVLCCHSRRRPRFVVVTAADLAFAPLPAPLYGETQAGRNPGLSNLPL